MTDPLLFLAAQLLSAVGETSPRTLGEDETLVTARKQAEALFHVPLSLTVVDERELLDARLLTVREAASRVPNLFFSEFTARRLSFPFVRGVGSGLGDPAVITYIDDVPQFGFGGTNLPLVGIERVEFLRGPQGTLYGKNALGGLIHVHGRRPTNELELGFSETFGNYDLLEHSQSVSGPLGGGVFVDLAVLDSERDGYTTNDFTGNSVDDRDSSFARGRVLWNPSRESELDFTLFGESARDGGFALSDLNGLRARPHHINQDFEGRTERDVVNPALVWRVFGDPVDFTSVSSWESWEVLETSDFDFSQGNGVVRRTEEDQRYFYQELRLGSNADAKPGELRWLAGASAFRSRAQRQAENDFGPDLPIGSPPAGSVDLSDGQFDGQGTGLFGQVSVPLGAVFELTGGLRYDREKQEAESTHVFIDPTGTPLPLGQIDDDETFAELLPMLSASAQLTAEALVFVRAARGFKAGGFNLAAPPGNEAFDAETNWTYELGYRQAFAEERHELAATLFWIDWDDRQVSLFDPNAGGFVDNAGAAESQGLELEGRSEILPGLETRASFGLLDTEIRASDSDLPQAPDTTWSLGLQYGHELARAGRLYVRADYQSVGDFNYAAGNSQGDSFDLVSAALGFVGEHFDLSLWVKNLFDEEYVPIAFQSSPFDPNSFVGESGAPRVLGFTLSAHL